MFVENFQILLGEKTHVGGIFWGGINRRVDMLIRATRVSSFAKRYFMNDNEYLIRMLLYIKYPSIMVKKTYGVNDF